MENVIKLLIEPFQHLFMYKALFAGMLIGASCSLLGVSLVVKNFSMIGEGLAHVSFAAIAFALLLSVSPIIFSIPIVIIFSIVILTLSKKENIHGDSAIGMIAAFSIAVGVIIASLSNGFNVDLLSFLFGSILFVGDLEIIIAIILTIAVITFILLFYQEYFIMSYDEEYAVVLGLPVKTINYVLIIFTSITIVIGIRIVGTMLISSLIIFPAVTALQISNSFKKALIYSLLLCESAVILGIYLSYILDIPTGASIVVLSAIYFILTLFIKKILK